jgi:hypothetical protein
MSANKNHLAIVQDAAQSARGSAVVYSSHSTVRSTVMDRKELADFSDKIWIGLALFAMATHNPFELSWHARASDAFR